MKKEEWRDVVGYEGIYQVSNYGEVRNAKRLLRPHKNARGYMRVRLTKNGENKTTPTHRLVATAFIPNPDNKPQVNHKNCIKHDNWVENLEWCTAHENIHHAMRMGLRKNAKGERQGLSILTEREVREIRKLKSSELSNKKLGEMFGCSSTNIFQIIHRNYWKHI